jgi:hypothetical protein
LDIGHPDVAKRLFAHPPAVVVELVFVLGNGGGQVGGRRPSVEEPVARLVPAVEPIHRGPEGLGVGSDLPVRGDEPFIRPDDHGATLAGRLGRALVDKDLGRVALADVEAIKPLFEDVERSVGGVDFDALLPFEGRHPEVGLAGPEMDLDVVVAQLGEGRELGLARNAEPEEVPPPELDLCLAVRGHELIALRNGEIDLGRLRPELRSPLDGDFALDEGQPGVTLLISLARLG